MKLMLNYLFCLGLVLFLGACSKKKVEKWLVKGTGEWHVKSMNVKSYENDTLQSDDTYFPNMKFVFNKNGNCSRIDYLDAEKIIVTNAYAGTWTNSKDAISIVFPNGYLQEIKILEIAKTKMTLEETVNYIPSEKYITTYWLEREK